MEFLTQDRGYDNVLLGQGCRTPHGEVIDEHGTMVERRLAKEKRKTLGETCFIATSYTANLTWSPRIEPGQLDDFDIKVVFLSLQYA
jgi:hypothetical protein